MDTQAAEELVHDVPYNPLNFSLLWIHWDRFHIQKVVRLPLRVEIPERKEQGLLERHLEHKGPDLQL